MTGASVGRLRLLVLALFVSLLLLPASVISVCCAATGPTTTNSLSTTALSEPPSTYDAPADSAQRTHRSRTPEHAIDASTSRFEAGDVAKPVSISRSVIAAKTASGPTSQVLLNSSKQLQSKFKHASDFGVPGNYSPANATKFSEALNQHINSPGVQAIQGTYRGNPATHYLDPSTGVNVITDRGGTFVSGWQLNPAQLNNVLQHGGL